MQIAVPSTKTDAARCLLSARELLQENNTYAAAYATFLQSVSVPPSLEDDIYQLDKLNQQSTNEDNEVHVCLLYYYNIQVYVYSLHHDTR